MYNNYYQSTINLHGKEQSIMLLDPRYDFNNNQSVKISNYHHIQIIDRSGSMYSYIDELIDNIQETISILNPDDLLSIIWFSGPGEFRTLIKGAKKTDNLIPLLDSIRSTVSTTCFSEPLMEAEKIIEELAQLCPNFSLTLFTDGCPVVPWGAARGKNSYTGSPGKSGTKAPAQPKPKSQKPTDNALNMKGLKLLLPELQKHLNNKIL